MLKKKRKVYAVRRHDRSLCTQKQPEACLLICVCVQVHYVLNKAPPGWTGAEGFITSDLIKKHFPPPGEGVKILRCGPLPMNKAMKAHLDALGYTPEMQFEF